MIDLEKKTVAGTTLLSQLVREQRINDVAALIDAGASVNVQNYYGYTPLHHAIHHLMMTHLLLCAGANSNVPNKRSELPLHCALENHKNDVAEVLLQKTKDINHVTEDKSTALHCAAWKASPKLVSQILDLGADLEAKDAEGNTPIMKAALGGNREIIDILIAEGANCKIKNNQGKTPADLARERNYTTQAAILEEASKCVRLP